MMVGKGKLVLLVVVAFIIVATAVIVVLNWWPGPDSLPVEPPEDPQGQEPTGESQGEPVPGTGPGELAPDFALPDLVGDEFTLSDFQGQVVVLSFWNSNCDYCLASLPTLFELQSEEGVQVMTINLGDTAAGLQSLWEKEGYEVFTLLDDGTVAALYQVLATPDTLVIDPQGVIKVRFLGARPPEELRRAVAANRGGS